ncbi:unnamed protein product [Didymodactylos carnosus]|uniref:Reverse transcriptase/retrotransposon-derived protein RNase H-like domain-containing protein n=2 Tax=Didymodactylos carnosus TaxID=1234261 RepID=A0A815GNZ1_9BILA|nr:unnamed protein product [Didymodactylos carnosus]CAF4202737.1 unnamed protein product [Didymodactylos carnosus]
MRIPDIDQQFILELVASEYGLAAVLAQELDRKKSAVAYASRTLTPAERNRADHLHGKLPAVQAGCSLQICKDLGIKNKFTATCHLQTNMTERVNKTVKQMIAQYAEGKPNSWDKEIAKLAFSIKTPVDESTGQPPAFLNLGREPQLPLDLILDDPTEGPSVPPDEIKHVALSYRDRLSQMARSL